MPGVNRLRNHLRAFALQLPEAYADFPWGEVVLKVNRRIFLFLGRDQEITGFSVKLDQYLGMALSVPGAAPTRYGLGTAGWVTLSFGEVLPERDLLRELVEESYRLVAPKRLVAELDRRAL